MMLRYKCWVTRPWRNSTGISQPSSEGWLADHDARPRDSGLSQDAGRLAPGSRSLFRNARRGRAPGFLNNWNTRINPATIDRAEAGPLYCSFALAQENALACLESFRMRPHSWPAW